MKKRMGALAILYLCLTAFIARGQTAPENPASKKLPGQQIAHTISLITGVAISPLLGVSAVGAWEYIHANTEEQKARLHWYANPWFWVPALFLVLLCMIKDTAGTALPTALKKPLDVVETIEHKISGLIATGAFVPLAVSVFEQHQGGGTSWNNLGFAAVDPSALYHVAAIALSMFVFVIVFLASNAINILILLSPFTTIDAALKAFRGTILVSVAVSAWISPWFGAIWALIIVVIAYFIAGWSFRLSYFGLTFVWDFVTLRCRRFVPDPTVNKVFLSRKIQDVPARTYGKLLRGGKNTLSFHYHPWLVLPPRTLALPEGACTVGQGLVYSEILRVKGDETQTMILLPPRYRGHENELAAIYGFNGVRDTGIRAAWAWLKGMIGGRSAVAQA